MVGVEVTGEDALQVALVEHDHVVEEIATNGLDPTFRESVLPGAARGDLLGAYAHVLDRGEKLVAVLRVAVEDEVEGASS